jgi:hypothetical protein
VVGNDLSMVGNDFIVVGSDFLVVGCNSLKSLDGFILYLIEEDAIITVISEYNNHYFY